VIGDPFPTPTRTEPRGDFPSHLPIPAGRRLLSREQARDLARANLAAWIKSHGGRAPDGI
jgi:hypothetical protein